MAERIKLPGLTGTWNGAEVEVHINEVVDVGQGEFAQQVAQKAKADASAHGDVAKGIRARRRKGSRPKKRTGWQIVSSSPLSAFLEYGTRQRTRKSGGKTGAMPKFGLLWPAVDDLKREFAKRLGGSL